MPFPLIHTYRLCIPCRVLQVKADTSYPIFLLRVTFYQATLIVLQKQQHCVTNYMYRGVAERAASKHMKMTESTFNTSYKQRVGLPALSLIVVGVLAACSDSGISSTGSSTDRNNSTDSSSSIESSSSIDSSASVDAQVTPGAARPSFSAAQLALDSSVRVQSANTETAENPDAQQPVIQLAAANPFESVNTNVESQSTTDTDTDVESTTPAIVENSTPDNEEALTSAANEVAPAVASTDVEPLVSSSSDTETSAAQTTGASASPDTATLAPLVDPVSGSASSENSQTTDNSLTARSFVSVTTPGFEGEVMDDAIRVTWQADPTARGYNVYKQAEYYTTVFTTEFIDTDVYDDDYYYEIQAFDNDDKFNYVATGLTVSARTLGRTDPDAPATNEGLLDDYALVFSDEFNGDSLDTSKWDTSFIWGTDLFINGEEQYYVDIKNEPDFGFNPFSFDGDNLTISTIETPPELAGEAVNQPYLSGIITSYTAFKFTYGYAETRAKFTHGRGYWPAFWLLNAYYVDAKPEIDIMEFIGHNQDVMYHTYHYFDSDGELRSTKSHPVAGIDFTADYHTFAVEWSPGELVFYVDGIETKRVIDINVSQQEMYVLANQAVGGWWAGSPDETTPIPGDYIIDYIRVYQRVTPHEVIQFDQPDDLIPLYIENPGSVIPNKRPPIWLWPEGYPDGQ